MSKKYKPFRQSSLEELTALIGQKVRKASNKPFSNGEKLATIAGITTNEHSGQRAFTLDGAELCDAHQCILVDDPGPTHKGESEVCEQCKASPPNPMHTCPYAEEIGGDDTTLCNCCGGCEHECAMDI